MESGPKSGCHKGELGCVCFGETGIIVIEGVKEQGNGPRSFIWSLRLCVRA